MTLRKWAGPAVALVLAAVLGCSSSATAQPATAPSEINPTWTAVRTPDGNDGYITDFCFDGEWIVMTYISTPVYGGYDRPLSVATALRC